MLCHVALVRTDVSEELSACIIRVTHATKSRLLVTANVPSSRILVTLLMEALSSCETSVHTRATWHNIPDDAFFYVVYMFTIKRIRENINQNSMQKGKVYQKPTLGQDSWCPCQESNRGTPKYKFSGPLHRPVWYILWHDTN
jgi:hypothetical protein